MEELHESEVMWPEYYSSTRATASNSKSSYQQRWNHGGPSSSTTEPVNIPAVMRRNCSHEYLNDDVAELVPPHVLVSRGRAAAEKMGSVSSSVCSGLGRTLKGRDLRHVRNSVLRMTGFLEG